MSVWDIAGRTVAITGASGGIGKATAVELARLGADLVLIGRDAGKHESVLSLIADIGARAWFVEAELADLSSVARAGRRLCEFAPPVAVLINNAAVGGVRGTTADGFEIAFGVNHLAHFLLTRLVLDSLVAGAPSRILTLSSEAHRAVKEIDWDRLRGPTRSLTGVQEYRQSKAANIAFTLELSQRLQGVEVVAGSIHPGLVGTGIWRRIPPPLRGLLTKRMVAPELGAAVVVNCAIAPELVAAGYYTPAGPGSASRFATDPGTTRAVWEKSEEMVARWL